MLRRDISNQLPDVLIHDNRLLDKLYIDDYS